MLEIHPGSRAAVNVSGINVEDIHRGEILTYPGCYETSKLFDVYIEILKDANRPLKDNSEVKIFHMASERVGNVHILGNNEIKPGDGGYAQIATIEPMVLYKNDRFILRIPSPGETIGGGVILRAVSNTRIKKSSFQDEISKLRALKDGTVAERIHEILSQNGIYDIALISNKLDLQPELISKELDHLVSLGEIKAFNLSNNTQLLQKYCSIGFWKSISQNIYDTISNYQIKYSLRIGITREELRSRVKIDSRQFNEILEDLLSLQEIRESDRLIHLPDHQVNISSSDQIKLENLQKIINENPYTPPSVNEANEIIGQELFNAMLQKKEFIRVSAEIFFRNTEFEKMKEFVITKILSEGKIAVTEFRDSFNSSRKYSLAFLEYLDSMGITIRQGDIRVPGKNQ
jgi:selenocysteine-specific elongation factor